MNHRYTGAKIEPLFILLVGCGPSPQGTPLTDAADDSGDEPGADSGRSDVEIIDSGGRADDTR